MLCSTRRQVCYLFVFVQVKGAKEEKQASIFREQPCICRKLLGRLRPAARRQMDKKNSVMYRYENIYIDYNIDCIHILWLKHFLFTSLQQLTCSISICIYVFFCEKTFVICFQWCFRICITQRFQFFSEIDYRHWSSSWIYSLAKDF